MSLLSMASEMTKRQHLVRNKVPTKRDEELKAASVK